LSSSKASNNDNDTIEDKDVHLPDFVDAAQNIQNQMSCRVMVATTEVRHFREFFGRSVLIVKKNGSCSRETLSSQRMAPQIICFEPSILKVYPKQSLGCLVVGASASAIDPKTHHKWVWTFMNAIADILYVMASNHNGRALVECAIFENA
jgi:hypothetical protein